MRSMRILALTALALAAPAWTDQTSGVTARLRGVSAVSDHVAWASGSAGHRLQRFKIVGGDYRKESEAIDNAAMTNDGGRSWTKVTGLSGFRSVVSYLPDASSPTLVAVGPQGADQSTDDGHTWTPLPGASGLHTFAFAKRGRAGWGAGEKGRIMRLLY